MEPVSDVSCGAWLASLLGPSWQDMHIVVPRSYPTYARIFHPASRDRPVETGTWHGYQGNPPAAIEEEAVSWETVAATFGTTMHPLAQYHRLVGPENRGGQEVLDREGWRYFEPQEGILYDKTLALIAAHLAVHTTTPDTVIAAVWEGWGGLTSSAGVVYLTKGWGGVGHGGFAADPEPGTGTLPADVASGPRLELPGRPHFLFEADVQEFTDPESVSTAPWNDDFKSQSPNILWPGDHAWVLVTEIDFDSTVVAGSRALITALVNDPDIEALEIPEGADLSWDADAINRPAD